jgi:hypothetical protein
MQRIYTLWRENEMRIKHLVMAGLLALAASAVLICQTGKPDFSGAWSLEMTGRVLEESGGGGMAALSMVIEHKDPQLTIKRSYSFQGKERVIVARCTTDGRPSTYEGLRPGTTVKVAGLRWKSNYLSTYLAGIEIAETPQGARETTVEFKLSADGKTLTIETSSKDNPSAASKLVYVKKQ